MPVRHDFLCETCHRHGTFFATPSDPPLCCDQAMVWAPRPGSFVMDAYEPGQEFDVDHNGQTFHIDSLSKLREVERQTAQQHRNGEGSPLVWRDYSQDRSNVGVHTLAKDVTQPVGGYAEGTSGVDKKFAGGRGAAVTAKHGEAT